MQSAGNKAAVGSSTMLWVHRATNHGNGPELAGQANLKQKEWEESHYNHAGKSYDESLQSVSMCGGQNQAKTGCKPSDNMSAKKHPTLGPPWSCNHPGCGRAYKKTV